VLRYPNLHAEQVWRQMRWYAVGLIVLGIATTVIPVVSRSWHFDRTSLLWLSYVPAGLMVVGMLTFYRRRCYIQATDRGLVISVLFRRVTIDWDLIRSVRVQPLGGHFQEGRKKLIRPISRALMNRPAVFVRLKDDPRAGRLPRQLGRQLATSEMVALPVKAADPLCAEIASRLPERSGLNLGGQKRRNRGR